MTITAIANAKSYAWSEWLLGIFRSFISGGSSAMVSGLASIGIAPDKFNLTSSVGNTLKLMGVMFLFQGGYRMFEFLQLHGAPDQLATTLQVAADATAKAKDAISVAKTQVEETKP